jgi:hypothetical protein
MQTIHLPRRRLRRPFVVRNARVMHRTSSTGLVGCPNRKPSVRRVVRRTPPQFGAALHQASCPAQWPASRSGQYPWHYRLFATACRHCPRHLRALAADIPGPWEGRARLAGGRGTRQRVGARHCESVPRSAGQLHDRCSAETARHRDRRRSAPTRSVAEYVFHDLFAPN